MARLTSDLKVMATGEQAGSVTAVQLANIPCSAVQFKGKHDNTGIVAIGRSAAVTLPAGTTTTTAGYPLDAGEEAGTWPCANLSDFWIICAAATDDLIYVLLN